MSVIQNSLATHAARHYKVSVPDIQILRENLDTHIDMLKKKDTESEGIMDVAHSEGEEFGDM